jgi:hypothetical protein
MNRDDLWLSRIGSRSLAANQIPDMRLPSLPLLVLATLMAGCVSSTPQSRINDNRGAYADYPSEVRRLIREGRVDVGFTAEMAEMALGRPGEKVSRREADNEETEIWIYYRNRPRLSIGMAVGSGGYRSTSTGISMSTRPDPDMETMRLILQDGHVIAIETVTR